jgi:hypothetical protein
MVVCVLAIVEECHYFLILAKDLGYGDTQICTREMRPEYDFSGGVRGKYDYRYRGGKPLLADTKPRPKER